MNNWDAETANRLLDLYQVARNYDVSFTSGNEAQGYNSISPFRKEKNPSFTVFINNKGSWSFHDKGGHGVGSALDFIMLKEGVSFKEALQIANQKYNPNYEGERIQYDTNTISSQEIADEKKKLSNNTNKMAITSIKLLNNPALINYLQNRKIDLNIAKTYLKEVYYTNEIKGQNRNFFGLCFENNLGGFEIRNKTFKGAYGNKGLSIIKGLSSEKVIVVEGFMSALSALTYYKTVTPKYDMVILNSTVNANKFIKYVKENNIKEIFDLLDNDFSGQETAIKIRNNINQDIKIINTFKIYNGINDFNDFICK